MDRVFRGKKLETFIEKYEYVENYTDDNVIMMLLLKTAFMRKVDIYVKCKENREKFFILKAKLFPAKYMKFK